MSVYRYRYCSVVLIPHEYSQVVSLLYLAMTHGRSMTRVARNISSSQRLEILLSRLSVAIMMRLKDTVFALCPERLTNETQLLIGRLRNHKYFSDADLHLASCIASNLIWPPLNLVTGNNLPQPCHIASTLARFTTR